MTQYTCVVYVHNPQWGETRELSHVHLRRIWLLTVALLRTHSDTAVTVDQQAVTSPELSKTISYIHQLYE